MRATTKLSCSEAMVGAVVIAVLVGFVHSGRVGAADGDDAGAALYALVEAYAELGDHRTGTEVDRATIAWFAEELARRGGKVERQRFRFDRFEATSRVTIEGEDVPSLPLYYEGVGEVQSEAPAVASVEVMRGHRGSAALEEAIATAKRKGAEIVVVATETAGGYLTTPNRKPEIQSGLPTVLVPGRYGERLTSEDVAVRYAARLVEGESWNVVARFGEGAGKSVVLATPLSGWFTCAAERGTGIAVLLGLAERLSARWPVLVVGSPGHELLDHIGLEAYLEENAVEAALVVHLGANLALGVRDAERGELRLAAGIDDPAKFEVAARMAFVRMEAEQFATVRSWLANADLPAIWNPPAWYGEGALWAEAAEGPVMSFVGRGPRFHTPQDVPETTTSAELLATVYESIGGAIEAYMAAEVREE